jgi:orotidine-5'-phosphate decarboxylase
MKTFFIDQLAQAVCKKETVLCLGLDTSWEYLPDFLFKNKNLGEEKEEIAEAIWKFNQIVIDEACPFVAAVKPNIAFYEKYGSLGIKALERTINYSREKGLLVIIDAKRGDGGKTAAAYAETFLPRQSGKDNSPLACDALTINGSIGSACVNEFLKVMEEGGGGFVLCKTSFVPNSEIESTKIEGSENYLWMKQAELIREWGKNLVGECGYSSLGAVVGATYPEEMEQARKIMPQNWFLVPGYGAQGGEAISAVVAVDKSGLGVIVNSSRGIVKSHLHLSLALSEGDFRTSIRNAAQKSQLELEEARRKARKD